MSARAMRAMSTMAAPAQKVLRLPQMSPAMSRFGELSWCGIAPGSQVQEGEHIATFKTSKRVSIDGSKADYSTFKLHAEHSGVVATIQNPTKMTPDSPFAVLVDSQEEREYFQMQTPPKRPFKQQTKW